MGNKFSDIQGSQIADISYITLNDFFINLKVKIVIIFYFFSLFWKKQFLQKNLKKHKQKQKLAKININKNYIKIKNF